MKKVKYLSDIEAVVLPMHVLVKKGDIIEVPDDFNNGAFEDVHEEKKSKKTEEVAE